jgi:uncharacterized protein with beta-barrel porin domain
VANLGAYRFVFVPAALIAMPLAHGGPLDEYTAQARGSLVHQNIAGAIQTVCPQLVGSFGGMTSAIEAPASPRRDITLRCNELIQTAIELADPEGAQPARSLRYTEADQLLAALQQVTGEEAVAQNTMTTRAANSQYTNIAARLDALRLAVGSASSSSSTAAFNFEPDETFHAADGLSALGHTSNRLGGGASADEPGLPAAGIRNRGGLFLMGSYNGGDRDTTPVEDGFDFDTFNLTVGVDRLFSGGGVIGLAVGYDDFSADFHVSPMVSGGEVEASGVSLSVFGSKDFGTFFLDGIAGVGQLDFGIERMLRYASDNPNPDCLCPDQNRLLSADSEGDYYSLGLMGGWRVYKRAWLIQPTVAISLRNYRIDGYTEQDLTANGGMPLRIGDQDIDSLRLIVGLQFQKAVSRSFGVLRPSFQLSWYHEFEDDPNIVSAKYAIEDELAVTQPGLGFNPSLTGCLSCFQLTSEAPDQNFAVLGAGLTFVFPNSRVFTLYYEGLFGYQDLNSNAISASFRRQF